jgi:DNA-binding transcriptional regulator YiaG
MNSLTLNGKKYILVPEEEYRLLRAGAPAMPDPVDRAGNLPAIEAGTASIARQIVAMRLKTGLSQKDFAALAGIRPEVLNRAERGVNLPSMTTLARLQKAAEEGKLQAARPRRSRAAS